MTENCTRLAESVSVNKAQAVFTSVINLLADGRKSHVPFADSAVTRLMKVNVWVQ
jgi:hypothetical protein